MTPTSLISVVVPTCNRLGDLARCLESLTRANQEGIPLKGFGSICQPAGNLKPCAEVHLEKNTSPEACVINYEVIVTDDGHTGAPTRAMIAERFPWAKWTQGPCRGPAANRNNGAKHASGDWVVFIDDDCVADACWLQEITAHAINPDIDVIEGRTMIPEKRDNPFFHGVENETGGCYWSCNLAVRRSRFLQIGGFDEDFLEAGGEDMEFAWRLQQQGLKPVFEPNALVLHPQRIYSFYGFLKRVPLLKWSLLCFQKTGQSPPPGSSKLTIVSAVMTRYLMNLFRQSWRNVTGKNSEGFITRLFNTGWMWLVSPYQIPYLLWWEFQFRRVKIAIPTLKEGKR
jgi:GT2 family glycosyltransferase